MMIMIFEANIEQVFRPLRTINVATYPDFVRIKQHVT